MTKMDLLAWLDEGSISIPTVLLTSYKQIGLSEEELVLLLHVFSFIEKGNDFPTPQQLSERMTYSAADCSEMLSRLIQRGFVEISDGDNAEGIRFEKYSVRPLLERVIEQFLRERNQQQRTVKQADERDLYTTFEKEFGRPLSPFECESLAIWIDDDRHDEEIIKAALREAVISGKLNFRYIDRILFDWKRNGIKTIEQARQQGKKFRQYQNQPKQPNVQQSNQKPAPFYNWLEQ